MDRKTNINNLTIVWQGQSWSVIAPNGKVLARCVDKWEAVRYAKSNTTYISTNLPPENYVNSDFMEFETYIYSDTPRKSRTRTVADQPVVENDFADDEDVIAYHPEKRKRDVSYVSSDWRDSLVDRVRKLASARKLFITAIVIGTTVVGTKTLGTALVGGVQTAQATLANIDWGALLIQGLLLIAAILGILFAITVVGAAIMTIVTIGAMLLGLILACGLLTSLVIGWPWKF